MRTREEQIEDVAIEWVEETGWGDGVSHDRARQIILEAERRAEQRGRTPMTDQQIAILILIAVCGWPWIHIALAYHEIKTRD